MRVREKEKANERARGIGTERRSCARRQRRNEREGEKEKERETVNTREKRTPPSIESVTACVSAGVRYRPSLRKPSLGILFVVRRAFAPRDHVAASDLLLPSTRYPAGVTSDRAVVEPPRVLSPSGKPDVIPIVPNISPITYLVGSIYFIIVIIIIETFL